MGETTDQIAAHIEDTREDLGSNLRELEQKVKSVTDWKQHFQNSPMTMVGVAFGGGILLASMLGGKHGSRHGASALAAGAEPHAGSDQQKYKAMETWDNIKGAIIGVAATRFKDFVAEVIPGFDEQYQRTAAKTDGRDPAAAMNSTRRLTPQ
jgi:hypothetical protein